MTNFITSHATLEKPSLSLFKELIPFIEEVDFPALREDLIQEAERRHVPSRLSLFLKWMDGRIYQSLSDVEAAFYRMTCGLQKSTIYERW